MSLRSKHLRRAGALALTIALLTCFTEPARANSAGALLRLFNRPITKLALTQTRAGALLGERLLGHRFAGERDLRDLARILHQDGSKTGADFLSRIELLESEARMSISLGAKAEGALAAIERDAAKWLAIVDGAGMLKPQSLRFVQELPRSNSYQRARAKLFDPEEKHLATDFIGADLRGQPIARGAGLDFRLSVLRGSRLGDLRGADLRGADLRGAIITSETRLEAAIYDQFTAIELPRSRVARLGMVYKPSAPPEGFLYQNVKASKARAATAGAPRPTPEKAQIIADMAIRRFDAQLPDYTIGVKLFTQAKNLNVRGQDSIRLDAGTVIKGVRGGPAIDALIDELAASGGELRRILSVRVRDEALLEVSSAYFAVEAGKPVIGLGPYASLATIAHERQHFRDWRNLVERLLKDGKTQEQALELAAKARLTAKWKRMTERNATTAEFKTLLEADAAAGVPLYLRVYRYESRRFAATVTYPEREAIGRALTLDPLKRLRETSQLAPKLAELEANMRKVIRVGLQARRSWFKHQGFDQATTFSREELFNEAISSSRHKYAVNGVLDDATELFFELLPREVARLKDDAFKRAVLESLAL